MSSDRIHLNKQGVEGNHLNVTFIFLTAIHERNTFYQFMRVKNMLNFGLVPTIRDVFPAAAT